MSGTSEGAVGDGRVHLSSGAFNNEIFLVLVLIFTEDSPLTTALWSPPTTGS